MTRIHSRHRIHSSHRVLARRSLVGGVVILLALVACSQASDVADATDAETGRSISAAKLANRIAAGDAPYILDVRTRAEYDDGHIPGAVNIPVGDLADHLAELPSSKDTEIVLHCRSGRRAAQAEPILKQAGYTNIRDLEGHIETWQKDGHPLE